MRSPPPKIQIQGMRVPTHNAKGSVNIEALPIPPPLPNAHIDPTPWNRADRATPGMTNRILEERLPENPFPFNYMSSPFETPINDQAKVMPEVLRRRGYFQYALVAVGILVVWSVFKF